MLESETSATIRIMSTPYGGRGLHATQLIPKNTLLPTSGKPYAATILKKFRKEVCGNCFAYAFTSRRNTWNIKADGPEGFGVWFCTVTCRDAWLTEQNVDGLLGSVNEAIERFSKSMREPKESQKPSAVETMCPEEITQAVHDLMWKNAEEMYSKPGRISDYLDELELDVVRFVASAIIRRYSEDRGRCDCQSPGWLDLLELQNNEIPHILLKPYMLSSHIRIYGFLRKVVPPVLQTYVKTSEMVRALLARDQGNTFGIWEMANTGDKEMLGWGMYISASYFNHDCSPNVRRERVGRALHFFTDGDVMAGEELYISYVDIAEDVTRRRLDLSNNWYFNCSCTRCQKELGRMLP